MGGFIIHRPKRPTSCAWFDWCRKRHDVRGGFNISYVLYCRKLMSGRCLLLMAVMGGYRKTVFPFYKTLALVVAQTVTNSGIQLVDPLGRKTTLPYDCGRSWEVSNGTENCCTQIFFFRELTGCPQNRCSRKLFTFCSKTAQEKTLFGMECTALPTRDTLPISSLHILGRNALEMVPLFRCS